MEDGAGYECPVDGCEFGGTMQSVMHHITAKADGQHKGKHGSDYIDAIREKGSEALADVLDRGDEQGGEEERGQESEQGKQESQPDEEPAKKPAERESPGASGNATPGEAVLSPSTRGGTGVGASAAPAAATAAFLGIGSGDGSRKVLLGVALLVLLLVWYNSTRGGPESEENQEEEQPERVRGAQSGRGLIE